MGDIEDPSGDPPGVKPLLVSRATVRRLAAGVLAVYVVTLLIALLSRSVGS